MKVLKIIGIVVLILWFLYCLVILEVFWSLNREVKTKPITEEDTMALSVAESNILSEDLIANWQNWESQSSMKKAVSSSMPGWISRYVFSWNEVKEIIQSPELPNPFIDCEEGQYFMKPENMSFMGIKDVEDISGEIEVHGNRAGRISRLIVTFAYNIDGEIIRYSVLLYDGSDDLNNYSESDIYTVSEEVENRVLDNGLELHISKRSRNVGNNTMNYGGMIMFVKDGFTCRVNTLAKDDMETVDLLIDRCVEILEKQE